MPADKKSQRATPKLQRWVDLLATLLVRTYAVPFEDLATGVPDYADPDKSDDAREKMFERDKEELLAFGIPLEAVELEPGRVGYRLRRADFYLPYLSLAEASDADDAPAGVPADVPTDGRQARGWHYRALPSLAFEPDELAAVVEATRRVRALGDSAFAAHAASALRKLAFDLPVETLEAEAEVVVRERVDPRVLDALGEALLARRRVTVRYHSIGRDADETRTVEPWGLFFLSGHWYLAARDPARGAGRDGLRNFRVSRVATAEWHAKGKGRDYEIPADFRLRDHARSRHAWELGDGDVEAAVVAFHGTTGAVLAARTLGEPVHARDAGRDDATRDDAVVLRRFQVRRHDPFVRWLLTFAGDARPVEPPALVAAWRDEIARTRARYAPSAGAPPAARAIAVEVA